MAYVGLETLRDLSQFCEMFMVEGVRVFWLLRAKEHTHLDGPFADRRRGHGATPGPQEDVRDPQESNQQDRGVLGFLPGTRGLTKARYFAFGCVFLRVPPFLWF